MGKNFLKNITAITCLFIVGISSAVALRNMNETYALDTINGYRYHTKNCKVYYVTTCTTDTCNYSSIDGVSQSGTVKRNLMSVNPCGSNKKAFAVMFDTNGGSYVSTQTISEGSKVKRPADPTKSGYTFDYWSLSRNGDLKYNFDNAVNSNFTLYAIWKKNPVTNYTVSFNLNGGAGSIANQTIASGGKVTKPTNPTRSGYTFMHWSTTPNGSAYNFNNSVNNNITLYAVWQQNINYYTVSFNLNGGVGSVANQTIASGGRVTRPANPTRSGYTFMYWSTSTSGSAYNFNNSVSSNITLYAVWQVNSENTPVTYYTVKFDLNGGTGEIPEQKIESGKKVEKPTNNPTNGNSKFENWATSSQCKNNQIYDFDKEVTKDMTLYACYSGEYKITLSSVGLPFSYTNTINANGSSTLTNFSQEYDLVLVDTETYKMLNSKECPTVLSRLKSNKGISNNKLEEKCNELKNLFSCTDKKTCYENKYMVLSDTLIQDEIDEIVYLRQEKIIKIDMGTYNYYGLSDNKECGNEYNYDSKITSDKTLYQCYKKIDDYTVEVDNQTKTSNFGKTFTKIVLILLCVAVVLVPVVLFILKSRKANNVN